MNITITQKERELIDDLIVGTEPAEVENPFNGKKVILPPLGVALYDFIRGCEFIGINNSEDFTIARDLFCKLFPQHYMNLID